MQVLASVQASSIAPGLDVTLTGVIPDAATGKVCLDTVSTSITHALHAAMTAALQLCIG